MANAISTIAYEAYARGDNAPRQPKRDWLSSSPRELAEIGKKRVPFWLTLRIIPAFDLDRKRAVFRLPSRDYPFTIYSATTDIDLSSIRLFTTSQQLTADDLSLIAITGGNFSSRNRLRWQTPLLLLPHEAWRAEIVFDTPPLNLVGIHVNFEGIRMVERNA